MPFLVRAGPLMPVLSRSGEHIFRTPFRIVGGAAELDLLNVGYGSNIARTSGSR